jgi:hypothetical protein
MSRLPPRIVFSLVATWSSAVALPAFADEPNVCIDAYEQAQVSMKPRTNDGESTLLRARTSLLTCMRSNCKDWMVADCSRWLSEVEARIPTVVFSARNTAGRDLANVQVQNVSGETLVPRLDGRAIELEPGKHVFVFVAEDGTRVEKPALVREGEKAQSLVATFEASPEELAKARAQTGPRDEAPPRAPSTLRYVGYGAAGLGVVGLGIGVVFGATAISKKSAASCDASGACDDGAALDDARSAATAATVGFVAGGALLAGGIALVLFAPSSTVRVQARAAASRSGGFAGVGGTF